MLENEAFIKFWQVKYPNSRVDVNNVFMEVAYQAWLAGRELGFDEGMMTSQAISNDVLNFGKRKNKRG